MYKILNIFWEINFAWSQFQFSFFINQFERFGEDSQERVLDWLEDYGGVASEDPVIDLGCGNGVMLLEMVTISDFITWLAIMFMY